MKDAILLSKGNYTLIDKEDFEYFNHWKWHCSSSGYACRSVYLGAKGNVRSKRGVILLHRAILERSGVKIEKLEIDHYNGVKLDNRKANLRIATKSQNQMNTFIPKRNTSGFKGVSWDKSNNKWLASICINGKSKTLGRFTDLDKAAFVYKNAADYYFGEYARY